MSDFMLSQVKGLLNKVSEDMENLAVSNSNQMELLLGAIDDLAANMFATQAVVTALLEDHPVDAEKVKSWIRAEAEAAGQEAPKAEAMVDFLTQKKS